MTRRSYSALAALLCCAGLTAQIPEQVEVTRVASGLRFPAGLAWSREGFLVIADGLKHQIYRLDSDRLASPMNEDSNAAQGLAYDTESRLYICEAETRRLVRLDKHGKFETLAAAFEGKKLNSPNAVTVRRDGNVYFTDPAFGGAIDRRELSFNGVFHVSSRGAIEAIARWQTRPDGIALSADGRRLYVSDADRHVVVAFDLDSKGAAANQRDVIAKIDGVPSALCSDTAGRIYVSARGLAIYSPDGKLIRTLMTGERVIGCAFGGTDSAALFVATPGSVYRVTIGVKGALQY